MSAQAKAELVLLEPGATTSPAGSLRRGIEQRYVLLRAADEPVHSFEQRALQRASKLRRASQELHHVTYLAGELDRADWAPRAHFLSQLCAEMAPRGTLVVHAPGNVTTDVLEFISDLRSSQSNELELRAVFRNTARSTPAKADNYANPARLRFPAQDFESERCATSAEPRRVVSVPSLH